MKVHQPKSLSTCFHHTMCNTYKIIHFHPTSYFILVQTLMLPKPTFCVTRRLLKLACDITLRLSKPTSDVTLKLPKPTYDISLRLPKPTCDVTLLSDHSLTLLSHRHSRIQNHHKCQITA